MFPYGNIWNTHNNTELIVTTQGAAEVHSQMKGINFMKLKCYVIYTTTNF